MYGALEQPLSQNSQTVSFSTRKMAKVTFALFGFGNMGWYAYVIGFKMKFTNVVIESFRFTYFTCTDQGGGGHPTPAKFKFHLITLI